MYTVPGMLLPCRKRANTGYSHLGTPHEEIKAKRLKVIQGVDGTVRQTGSQNLWLPNPPSGLQAPFSRRMPVSNKRAKVAATLALEAPAAIRMRSVPSQAYSLGVR